MAKKKRAAYIEYAIHNRKKYENIAGKKLTIPELVNHANPDWTKESEEIKDFFKRVAKGEQPVKTAPRHETSCQRMDTEATVVTRMSVGQKWSDRKWEKIRKGCQDFEESLVSVEEIINKKIGIIDFNSYVTYLDGLTVPAEFAIVQGSLKEGLNRDLIYSELLRIEPFNKSHLRDGFRHELKISCEREHGIEIDKIQKQAVELEFFCSEVSRLITEDMLLLCRKEDVGKVLGSWYWLKQRHKHELPKIQLITLEKFVGLIVDYLITKHNRGEMGTRYSEHSLTDYFSKTFFDTEQEFRCNYHNSEEACDKPSCTMKNAKKYFYLLIKVLADFLPEVQLEDGKHVYTPPNSKKRIKRPQAAANTPISTPPETTPATMTTHYDPFPEQQMMPPRPPRSFSAKTKSDQTNRSSPDQSNRASPSLSNGSNALSANGLETDSEPVLPRRPNSTTSKQAGDGGAKCYTKSDFSYEPVPLKCQSNGASAVQGHCMPGLAGRGRSRVKSSTPSPPPEFAISGGTNPRSACRGRAHLGQATSQGYAAVRPGVTGYSVNGSLAGKHGVTSYGRGQRFATAQVTTVVSQTGNLSLSD